LPARLNKIEHSQIAYRVEHSAPVRAIVGTLLTGSTAFAPVARQIANAYHDNGLSGSFGNLSADSKITTSTGQPNTSTPMVPTGLAAAFPGYLSDAVGLNDLADAGYAPRRDSDHPSAARLCAQDGS
jgi:hypothetical protein